MGNTFSCCYRGSSRECQEEEEEEQRRQNKGKRSRKSTVKILEKTSVTSDTYSTNRSETLCTNVQDTDLVNPDLPLEVSQPRVASCQAASLETEALPTQVKPDDEALDVVSDNGHVNATAALDNSLFLRQQEVAAKFVSELLADAIRIMDSENHEMTDKGEVLARDTENSLSFLESDLPQPDMVSAALLEADILPTQTEHDADVSAAIPEHVNTTSAVENSILLQQEVAARFVSDLLEDATKIVASTNLNDKTNKGESLTRKTDKEFLESHVPADVISVHVDALSPVDTNTFLQQQEVAASFVSQLLPDATQIVASNPARDNETEERMVCQGESEPSPCIKDFMTQDDSAQSEIQTETESTAADTHVVATLLESQAAEEKVYVEGIILPKEDAITTTTARKLVDRLVQDPSAEDVANEVPKGFSLLTDNDAQLETYENQVLHNMLHMEDARIPVAKCYERVFFMEKPETMGFFVQIPEHNIAGQLALLENTSTALQSSPQYVRPGSPERFTPMSDGSEAWFTGDEDLYDSEEEVEPVRECHVEMTVSEHDQGSVELPVDILIYSGSEWRERTDKNIVIRKGYSVLSQSFRCLRQVREDNYSALRASLYQALISTSQPPDWLLKDSFLLIPQKLESSYGLLKDWSFPDICKQTFWINNSVDRMKHYLSALQKWWFAAAASSRLEGRRCVCEQLFQAGEEEFGIMEAIKLLMLARAVEFYTAMQKGENVPFLVCLLFARDTSPCPRTFLANHLSRVGFSGGVEQMEMILLGYALQCTIKVYRLHRANTEELITHYPVGHLQNWPSVCLVTKDDHHYNVPVGESIHPLWWTSMDHQSELPVDIFLYSEKEWKEQTDKNTVIRKGYIVLSQSFRCLQQVREDNYSALRASLHQALISTSHPPDWLLKDSFLLVCPSLQGILAIHNWIPEEFESSYGLIKDWSFPEICKQMFWIKNSIERMKNYLRLLQKWWLAAAACSGLEGRRRACEQLFQGGEEEFSVLEALKLLVLARAVEFYTAMQRGDDVPIQVWLLFARDTSPCPCTFLANHLSQVGFSRGVEQTEMFLLGFALQCTIKVYRLHRSNTKDFITYYPVDHLQDWPSVCLVTKDDHHYNVSVDHPAHSLWRTEDLSDWSTSFYAT